MNETEKNNGNKIRKNSTNWGKLEEVCDTHLTTTMAG
jgi:hypothetical protein